MTSNRRLAAAGLSLLGLIGLGSPCAAGHTGGAPEALSKRPVVVELYTSQGCSSCPPADALLGQLSARKDILALSLPITYWDMLGWKDTLASEANTRRQKAYARVLGRGGVYTPQMIVDGMSDVIGSREPAVTAAIGARLADGQTIPVELTASHQEVHVAVGPAPDRGDHDATIWLFRVLPQASVHIGDGENGGRTVTYHNVVRDIRAVGMWKGQAVTLDLPRGEVGPGRDGIAVVVQQGGYGRIVGAASIDRPDFDYIR